MKRKKRLPGLCPVCEKNYVGQKHKRTTHHIFPKCWYEGGVTVCVCAQCHQKEFNKQYPMKWSHVWTVSECVQNWVKFCKSKGKNAYEIYPQLCEIEPIY